MLTYRADARSSPLSRCVVMAFVAGGYAAAKSYQFTGIVKAVGRRSR